MTARSHVIFLIFLSLPILAHAEFTKYEVTGHKSQSFTLKEACSLMGREHSILTERISDLSFDCMGKETLAIDVCKKKLNNPATLIRGFVDGSSSQITCQTASRAIMTVICDERDKEYCSDSAAGCSTLKRKFAYNLETVHQSITENENGSSQLNCYFSVSKDLTSIDDPIL